VVTKRLHFWFPQLLGGGLSNLRAVKIGVSLAICRFFRKRLVDLSKIIARGELFATDCGKTILYFVSVQRYLLSKRKTLKGILCTQK